MLRSLPLVLTALLAVGACGDAAPVAPAPAESAPVAAPPSAVTETEGDVAVESASASDPAEASDPAATPAEATPRSATAPARGGTPMVEVNIDASVEHATSGAKQLTLRAGPSTSSENLGTFNYGFVMECQDLKRDDAWCRIRAEMPDREPVGWAKRRHLMYIGNTWEEEDGVRLFGNADFSGIGAGLDIPPDGFPVSARWDILADDGYANVRATPGADGEIVRRLDNRVMTDVVRCDGGAPGRRWCEISSPVRGWVHQSGFHPGVRAL